MYKLPTLRGLSANGVQTDVGLRAGHAAHNPTPVLAAAAATNTCAIIKLLIICLIEYVKIYMFIIYIPQVGADKGDLLLL